MRKKRIYNNNFFQIRLRSQRMWLVPGNAVFTALTNASSSFVPHVSFPKRMSNLRLDRCCKIFFPGKKRSGQNVRIRQFSFRVIIFVPGMNLMVQVHEVAKMNLQWKLFPQKIEKAYPPGDGNEKNIDPLEKIIS